jgi:hypothetical protein
MTEVDSGVHDADNCTLPCRARELVTIDAAPNLGRANLIHRRRAVREPLRELDSPDTRQGANVAQPLDGNSGCQPFTSADPNARTQRG